jgi:hypothetical protein
VPASNNGFQLLVLHGKIVNDSPQFIILSVIPRLLTKALRIV